MATVNLQPNQLTKRWTPLRSHRVQSQAFHSPTRFKTIHAGRRSGKTELAKRKLTGELIAAEHITKPWPHPRWFAAAPTRDQAKRVWWQDLKALTPSHIIDRVYESDLYIVTKSGAELWVVGLDKPQRIEGTPWDGGIVDECSDIRPSTFDLTIRPALADRAGWCWLIGVPKRVGVGALEYHRRCEYAASGEDPDWQGFTWFSRDILPAAEVDAAKRTLSPADFREQFEASWESAGNLVYDCFEKEHNVRPCSYHDDKPIIVGSDFNVTPMAWVLCHQYTNPDRLEVFDEIWLSGSNTRRALDELHNRYASHKGGFKFYGDATGRNRHSSATSSDYDAIKSDPRYHALGATVHYKLSNPAMVDRYAAVNAMLLNAMGDRRLFIDPRCKHVIDNLQHGYYAQGTREEMQTEDLSHITAALGYVVHYLYPLRRIRDETVGRFA